MRSDPILVTGASGATDGARRRLSTSWPETLALGGAGGAQRATF